MEIEEIKARNEEANSYVRKRIVLVTQRNYTQLLPHFSKMLRYSRIPFLKNNSLWIAPLQLSILRNIILFESEITTARRELKRLVLSLKEREDIENRELINQEWLRIIKTVADGIAWRNFKFDRPVLRLLSDNQGAGFIQNNAEGIYKRFINVRKGVMLINDITRYLRVGDLTHVVEDKIVIYELKENGKDIQDVSNLLKNANKHGIGYLFNNNRLSRQRHRQWTAQMSIVNRSIDVPLITPAGNIRDYHRAEIVDLDTPISTHHKSLRSLIRAANKIGISQEEVEPGYLIKVIAWDKFLKNLNSKDKHLVEEKMQLARENRPDWCKDKTTKVMDVASSDSFHKEGTEFPRNFTPTSVLPLSSKDCVRMMMGCLEVTAYLNLDRFKESLEEDGWEVEEIEHENYKPIQRTHLPDDFMKEVANEDFYRLSRSDDDGAYTTIMPLTLIIHMLSSYYKTNFLLNALKYQFRSAKGGKSKRRNVTFNFTKEKEILL